MITVSVKDEILSSMVTGGGMSYIAHVKDESKKYGVTDDEFCAILEQFEDLNLILIKKRTLGGLREFNVKAEAHDFYNRGGFVAHEMILKANIEKLGWELDKLAKDLAPKHLETVEKITSIAAAILSFLNIRN